MRRRTSPERPRAKPSGLTRTRERSICVVTPASLPSLRWHYRRGVRATDGATRTIPYAAWLAQPGYLAAEVLLALFAGVGYSLADDTISALGTGCGSPAASGCSSAPWAMNVVFVVFGALQALG